MEYPFHEPTKPKAFMTFDSPYFLSIYLFIFHSILSLNGELNLRPSILVIKAFMTFETLHIFLAFIYLIIFHSILSLNVELNLRASILVIKAS
jgi:hypothetical protein